MSDCKDFLFELGTEELPPKSLLTLSQALGREIEVGLEKAALEHGGVSLYAAPRRLAVWVRNLQTQQADQENLRKGPAEKAAFDAEGNPSRALMGFAKSCGVAVEALEKIDTPKGVWMGVTLKQKGVSAKELLPEILQTALDRLPIPKRMRWGASEVEFLRPVHWVVALLGDEVVPATLYNIESGNQTRGHRFHHPDSITITNPAEYVNQLKDEGMVMADAANRKARIEQQVVEVANKLNGKAVIDPALLDEVTALVEWPVAISGSFEERFLEVPQEALIASMQGHQKFFPVVDSDGQLMAHFITVSNIESADPSMVQSGNERVIRPRLSDAAFFWEQDLNKPLEAQQENLKKVVYQDKLGSLLDKSQRVATLAATIATQLGSNPDHASRAAMLGKCDLLTNMVKEFPELQGIMGRYYAEHANEPSEVAVALDEQYMPRFSGDQLPHSATGEAVALAERLDSLVGIFGIGMIPTGDKDPFALRRAALGLLRIMVENQRALDLQLLINAATEGYGDTIAADTNNKVFDFVLERLRGYYHEREVTPAVFDSVLSCRPTQPLDFDQRIAAVKDFVIREESASLSAANKRIHNLLKKTDEPIPDSVDSSLFEEDAEKALAADLDQIRQQLDDALAKDQYATALEVLSTLRSPVDTFFEAVMVMSNNDAVRRNRLALLSQLRNQFLRIADISLLHTS
ncbi:MAG: glycine--tRNA ligase subunit beta [Gammaproteobacteria bacterium]|jgi:glycyl-tRNA synthetase beta chain|nr:glycine--tRNA ligase subunit beta [Gammaproteobacteria bacterium]